MRPSTGTRPTVAIERGATVIRTNEAGSITLGADIPGLHWEPWSCTTGDNAFLNESVTGKRVADNMIEQALYGG